MSNVGQRLNVGQRVTRSRGGLKDPGFQDQSHLGLETQSPGGLSTECVWNPALTPRTSHWKGKGLGGREDPRGDEAREFYGGWECGELLEADDKRTLRTALAWSLPSGLPCPFLPCSLLLSLLFFLFLHLCKTSFPCCCSQMHIFIFFVKKVLA